MSRTWRHVTIKHHRGRGDRRRGACPTSKIRYRTIEAAAAALANIATQPHIHRIPVRAYLCPECAGFHLSSSPTWP